MIKKTLALSAMMFAFALTVVMPVGFDASKGTLATKVAFAKNGADDPAGDNRGQPETGDDHGGR